MGRCLSKVCCCSLSSHKLSMQLSVTKRRVVGVGSTMHRHLISHGIPKHGWCNHMATTCTQPAPCANHTNRENIEKQELIGALHLSHESVLGVSFFDVWLHAETVLRLRTSDSNSR